MRCLIVSTVLALAACSSAGAPVIDDGPHVGGKADGVDESEVPAQFYVRNELADTVHVLLGDPSTYAAWETGSGDYGLEVAGVSISELAPFSAEAFAVVFGDGSPLDPDSLRGSLYRDDDGTLTLELVVTAPFPDELAPLTDYVPDGEGEYISLDAPLPEEGDDSYVSAMPPQIGDGYTGSAVGYSTSTTTAWTWTTDSNKRGQLKIEAAEAAWSAYRGTQEYQDRLAGCRARGGTNLYIGTTDCSYLPEGAGAIYGGTRCRASCDWTYRCLRLGGA